MANPPRWVETVRGFEKFMAPASDLLSLLHQARGGGALDLALAGTAAARMAVNHFYPEGDIKSRMANVGFTHAEYFYFLPEFEILYRGLTPVILKSSDAETPPFRVYTAPDDPGDKIGFYEPTAADSAIYLRFTRKDSNGYFKRRFREGYRFRRVQADYDEQSSRFSLSDLNEPGPYISRKRPVSYYVDRLRRYGDGPRSVVIRGGSGYGKSVLAQHIATGLRPDGTILKLSSATLHEVSPNVLSQMADLFVPSVLLLDDVDLNSKKRTEQYLDIFERLRKGGVLVVSTHMVDPHTHTKPLEEGCFHYDGGRPGRIDEVFNIPPYDEDDRREIMELYAEKTGYEGFKRHPDIFEKIVRATENLSGAYLASLVEKISVHGIQDWVYELTNLKYQAPAIKTPPQQAKSPEEQRVPKKRGSE